tara:strand:+ start:7 stop:1011 length:1005 start_codon:yes stop_codon:yes gene_type:complete
MKGKQALKEFASLNKVPFETCGKVVVATKESEIPIMEKVYGNGKANGCEGIEIIDGDQVKDIEPFVECKKAIWVPTTGIVDFVKFTEVMAEEIQSINIESKILLNCKVDKVSTNGTESVIQASEAEFKADKVIFCGGLQADLLAKKDDLKLDLKIVPFRGDYYDLTKEAEHKVKNLIYPVPNPEFPFLGVHFTRMINGGVECGPNAVFSFKREGYSKTDFNLKDSIDSLFFPGVWKLFGKHWKQGLQEYKRAFSKQLFLNSLKEIIPSLEMTDIEVARSGVRAQALDNKGDLVYDFRIEVKSNHFHVLNAPSPAATACLAIGEYICDSVTKRMS